jgi:cytochrome c oxidase cbb3-type subunit 3
MMGSGTSVFVVVVTVLNVVLAVGLMIWMRKRRGEGDRTTDTTGHTWDGDLQEYNNPLPMWWLWLFYISVIFSVVYLVMYPGLGNSRGSLGWTQQEQWAELQAQQEQKTQAMLAQFAGRTPVELSADPRAIAVGRNYFANNCSTCHGSDARGATGFPNLTDGDWLWGGTPEAIETSIREGRIGVMAPWKDALGAQGVEDVVAYVLSLSGRQPSAGDVAAGRKHFETICVTCHGADGKGNKDLGAPNLTDQIWVHGGGVDAIRQTIANGRMGEMPAHGERLGEQRVKLLTAYVLSLGQSRVASSN